MFQIAAQKCDKIPWKVRKLSPWFYKRSIRFLVNRGIVPYKVPQGEVMKAMVDTKPSGILEMIGFLRVRVRRAATGKWEDYGLVSTKKVTTAFAAYVVDSFQNSTTSPLDTFIQHQMGDDDTAESNAHTDLQNAREAKVAGTDTENGANVFQTVATITATAGYTVNEHSITNNSANATGTMLDRNLVPNAPVVVADDQVEFTYELTVNAES